LSPTVQELYELWADEAELNDALQRSLAPRGVDSLFEAFLDPRMVYSCAYWARAGNLAEAQEHKLDLACRKLGLKPGADKQELEQAMQNHILGKTEWMGRYQR